MNLFCFTLEGSTDSLYEPAHNNQEVASNGQCSHPLLMHKAKWGGSDPCITSDPSETRTSELKRWNRRSHVPMSSSDSARLECPQPWEPSHHTCHHPRKDKGVDFTPPWTTESWDHFEKLVHELDTKQSEQLSPPIKINPITDLDISESTRSTSFGRSDNSTHHPTPTKPPDNGMSLEKQYRSDDPTKARGIGKKMKTISQTACKGTSRKPVKTLSERKSKETERDGADQREINGGGGGAFTEGHRQSSHSLESLYSLNSGQSSSSGVTSGSDRSSNRDSQMLDEDPSFPRPDRSSNRDSQMLEEDPSYPRPDRSSNRDSQTLEEDPSYPRLDRSSNGDSQMLEEDPSYPRPFCGRARVHTDFVPSPYDTESLTLKVGDVIDIIAKPPMGIWTGMLNDTIGTFKFIYVDVLVHRTPEPWKKMRTPKRSQKSQPKTLLELLDRLSLEEYASALLRNGYHTIDDLTELREQHLMELNMSDPEHRHRLLAAVGSLQQPQADHQRENETRQESEYPTESIKADRNTCPRDSGCHIPSEYSDNCKEDTEIDLSSFHGPLAETPAT